MKNRWVKAAVVLLLAAIVVGVVVFKSTARQPSTMTPPKTSQADTSSGSNDVTTEPTERDRNQAVVEKTRATSTETTNMKPEISKTNGSQIKIDDRGSVSSSHDQGKPTDKQKSTAGAEKTTATAAKNSSPRLPKLLDLGASKCIPCRMMVPVLEALSKEYKGQLEVEFIDVWEKPEVAQKLHIRGIPTQIFYDAEGKELWRHEGFISKEDIIAKFREYGINFEE